MISLASVILVVTGAVCIIESISFSDRADSVYKEFFDSPGKFNKTHLNTVRILDKASIVFMVLGAICIFVAFIMI